jgi:hypothetical protein
MIIGEILYGLLNSYEEYTVKKREERDSSWWGKSPIKLFT